MELSNRYRWWLLRSSFKVLERRLCFLFRMHFLQITAAKVSSQERSYLSILHGNKFLIVREPFNNTHRSILLGVNIMVHIYVFCGADIIDNHRHMFPSILAWVSVHFGASEQKIWGFEGFVKGRLYKSEIWKFGQDQGTDKFRGISQLIETG